MLNIFIQEFNKNEGNQHQPVDTLDNAENISEAKSQEIFESLKIRTTRPKSFKKETDISREMMRDFNVNGNSFFNSLDPDDFGLVDFMLVCCPFREI